MTFDDIRVGSTVTVRTPQGQMRQGRAVLHNKDHDLWVLNGGGRHGTPVIACRENFVRAGKNRSWRATS